jgi:hypothetical protein
MKGDVKKLSCAGVVFTLYIVKWGHRVWDTMNGNRIKASWLEVLFTLDLSFSPQH